ncbi:MAG: glycosyltransferase family 2 protein [Desulfurococcaceae archaeon]
MSYLEDITVLIPVKNEEEAIGRVLDEVLSVGVPRERVIVVDGHSTDGTAEIVKSRGVVLVEQEGNGKSDAIRTGLRRVSTKYVLVMDGDYTYPAKFIPTLLKEAKERGISFVSGKRVYGRENIPILNRLGNWLLTNLFNVLIGGNLYDVCTGMYLLNIDEFRDMLFETKNFSIEVELVAHVVGEGIPYYEYGIEYRKRLGRKKLTAFSGLQIAIDIVRLAWRYSPVTMLLMCASTIVIPGLIIGGYVAYHYFFTGINYYVKGLVAVFLTIAGLQAFMLAILSMYLKRMELRIRRLIKELINRSSA